MELDDVYLMLLDISWELNRGRRGLIKHTHTHTKQGNVSPHHMPSMTTDVLWLCFLYMCLHGKLKMLWDISTGFDMSFKGLIWKYETEQYFFFFAFLL